ncbi:diguanylate cyclase (GGDEF) domain-containing protein [Ruminococcaceae bacterium FB2012]|nr:diguanylate cyclase (GGDEF) domain-containing protein [Ruminococcaceae bacterium FB2012]
MTDLRLLTVNDISDFEFNTRIPVENLPERVILACSPYYDDIPLPEGMAALLLTDNLSHAQTYAGKKHFYVVYVGKADNCLNFLKKLYDVWNPADGKRMLYKRYRKTIIDIRNTFDKYFYEHALTAAINSFSDLVWFKRLDGIHTLVNDRFREALHKTDGDIIGRGHDYVWELPGEGDTDKHIFSEAEEIAVSTGKPFVSDEPVRLYDGMKQFTTVRTPLYDKYGNVFGTVGVGHDVTDFGNMGLELSILVESLPIPMTIFGADWSVIIMNQRFADLTGCGSEASRQSFDYQDWKDAALISRVDEETDPLEDGNPHDVEYIADLNGENHNLLITEVEIRDHFDNVSGYYVMMYDVTAERIREKAVTEAANTDMLTGLYNRRYFYLRLSEISSRPFTLIYMDLDRFKQINDSFGHAEGDAVLVKTGELIRDFFPGASCYRLGGDEFAAIDENRSEGMLAEQCRMLEAAVRDAFEKYGFGTGISIGTSHSTGSAEDIDSIFRKSDEMMYEVKERHHRKA